MKPDEITAIVTEAVEAAFKKSHCWMDEDDRGMVRDMIAGGKMAKKSFLVFMAGGLLYITAKIILSIEKFNPFK